MNQREFQTRRGIALDQINKAGLVPPSGFEAMVHRMTGNLGTHHTLGPVDPDQPVTDDPGERWGWGNA